MNNSFNYHSFMNDIHGKVKSVLDAEYLRITDDSLQMENSPKSWLSIIYKTSNQIERKYYDNWKSENQTQNE